MNAVTGGYYCPEPSRWPITGSIGLFGMAIGTANLLHGHGFGWAIFLAGSLVLAYTLFGWFGQVIGESEAGLYNDQVDRSFRWGMAWFIFSEVLFFAAFFGALFYARTLSVPWLGGDDALTNSVLWPGFQASWPLLNLPGSGFDQATGVINAWGIPAINTLILVSSGGTVTWAHWGLKNNNRRQLINGLILTLALGLLFLGLQVYEFVHAYQELNLKLSSGIYGTTFFMLTGFHGAHVTIGAIMLAVMLGRAIKGHFTPENHFAFEAASWYWHFVDVVWLCLFVVVYWL
jgi:cytochrome c oxidase subunit 3